MISPASTAKALSHFFSLLTCIGACQHDGLMSRICWSFFSLSLVSFV